MKISQWIKREAVVLGICLAIGGLLILLATWADIKLVEGTQVRPTYGDYYWKYEYHNSLLALFGPYLLLTIFRLARLAVKLVTPKGTPEQEENKLSKQ